MIKRILLLRPRLYRALFIISIPVVMVMMVIETPRVGSSIPQLDKIAHMLIFFCLTLFCSRGLRALYNYKVVLLLITFGLIIEFIQYLVPWRSFSWWDWFADIVGIMGYHMLFLVKHKLVSNKGLNRDV